MYKYWLFYAYRCCRNQFHFQQQFRDCYHRKDKPLQLAAMLVVNTCVFSVVGGLMMTSTRTWWLHHFSKNTHSMSVCWQAVITVFNYYLCTDLAIIENLSIFRQLSMWIFVSAIHEYLGDRISITLADHNQSSCQECCVENSTLETSQLNGSTSSSSSDLFGKIG